MIDLFATRGQAPFPFRPIFQNGPRRQGSAPPRKPRALDGSGPFRTLPPTRERGPMQTRHS